jgi:hypothetical protein
VALGGHTAVRRLVGVKLECVGHQVLEDPPELGAVTTNGRERRDLKPPVESLDSIGQRRRDASKSA